MTRIREVALVNSTDYSLDSRIRKPERLDETMTRSDSEVQHQGRSPPNKQCLHCLGVSLIKNVATPARRCPLLGLKRTSQECTALSAFDPKRKLAAQICSDAPDRVAILSGRRPMQESSS